jgi:excisionase family DNA binding protein
MQQSDKGQKTAPEIFEPMLDSQQAAELLRIHPESLKRRARSGEIPGLKFGKLWRFRASVLESYVRKKMQEQGDIQGEDMAPSDAAVCAVRNRSK